VICHRYGIAVVAVAVAGVFLTGCQGGEAGRLSVGGLTEIADDMDPDGADKCPLSYDLEKAAESAGLKGATGSGTGKGGDDSEPAATAEGGKKAQPGSPLATNPGALVSCTFHVGEENVQVHTVGAEKPQALSVLVPLIQSETGMSVADLSAYFDEVAKSDRGVPVLTKSGNVASVRLHLDGEGDAALLVSVGADGKTSMNQQQVTELARTLGSQAK
jgi:hypothetical protein